jgi:predicted negative regulator of RcsB-dependent stress response
MTDYEYQKTLMIGVIIGALIYTTWFLYDKTRTRKSHSHTKNKL